jgi:hypothetical protein
LDQWNWPDNRPQRGRPSLLHLGMVTPKGDQPVQTTYQGLDLYTTMVPEGQAPRKFNMAKMAEQLWG